MIGRCGDTVGHVRGYCGRVWSDYIVLVSDIQWTPSLGECWVSVSALSKSNSPHPLSYASHMLGHNVKPLPYHPMGLELGRVMKVALYKSGFVKV